MCFHDKGFVWFGKLVVRSRCKEKKRKIKFIYLILSILHTQADRKTRRVIRFLTKQKTHHETILSLGRGLCPRLKVKRQLIEFIPLKLLKSIYFKCDCPDVIKLFTT